jgi:NAD(P)-dependent dehydrogenase (short-subunit alcohol dehydrogenase family)
MGKRKNVKINDNERMVVMGILDGKVSIVTGAGSGMGRAIAKIYAREGSFVIIADMNLKTAEGTPSAD